MFDKTPPKGMRDFLPEDLLLREKISDTIKGVYRSYGFTGIETPCVEDLGLLTSKQGGDNEKLIFKILKRGEKLENSRSTALGDETATLPGRGKRIIPARTPCLPASRGGRTGCGQARRSVRSRRVRCARAPIPA